MTKVLFPVFLLFFLPSIVLSDVVYLKTGYVILNADVIEVKNQQFFIKADRLRLVPAENIEKILFHPLIPDTAAAIVAYDDTLRITNYFIALSQIPAHVSTEGDSAVTIILRNDSTLRATVSIDGDQLVVVPYQSKAIRFDAEEIRRVDGAHGRPLLFGTDANTFIRITEGVLSFGVHDSERHLYPFNASVSFGMGAGSSLGGSRYYHSQYPAPVITENFSTRYAGSLFYEHRVFQRTYLTLQGEYSRTRFEKAGAIFFWEFMSFRGGLKHYLPEPREYLPFICFDYGYTFGFLPIYSNRNISQRSEGRTFSLSFGMLFSHRFSVAATYASYRLSPVSDDSEKNLLRSLIFTLYIHINQSYDTY